MLLLLLCSPSSAIGLEEPSNATETVAPEPDKESNVAALSAVPATTMLIESSVLEEPPESIIADARGADLGDETPIGECTEVEEESPEIPTGKLMKPPSPV
jgi:hypothetical protein